MLHFLKTVHCKNSSFRQLILRHKAQKLKLNVPHRRQEEAADEILPNTLNFPFEPRNPGFLTRQFVILLIHNSF